MQTLRHLLTVSCLLGLCRQTLDLVGPGAKVSAAHGPVSWWLYPRQGLLVSSIASGFNHLDPKPGLN